MQLRLIAIAVPAVVVSIKRVSHNPCGVSSNQAQNICCLPTLRIVWYLSGMAKPRRDGRQQLTRWLEASPESKTDTATDLGMSVEQLRHIESGRRKPTLPQAVAFEDQLGIPVRAWA